MKKAVIAALFPVVSVLACGREQAPPAPEPVRPVKIMDIRGEGVERILEFPGTISPAREVTLAFEIPGRIINLPVKEGQPIKTGQALCEIDPRDYQSALNASQAQYDTAMADYERSRNLVARGAISRRDLDVARTTFETAEAALETALKRMEDTRLTAPFEGVVASILVDQHQNIQPKQDILVLQDISSLEIKVNIPEQDFVRGRPQGAAPRSAVTVSSLPGRTFPASFKEVATAADPATRTFEVTLGFERPDDIILLPGMTARASINIPDPAAVILIPTHAVVADDDGNPTVWVIDPGTMRARRRVIEVGELTGARVELRSGLRQGEMIAVSGVHQLYEDMQVSRY